MIILELIFFFLIITVLFMSFAGYGSLFTNKIDESIFLDIFIGFIVITLIITVSHFFFKINFFFNILILLCGLSFFLKKKIILNINKLFTKKKIINLVVVIALLPMFISQKYHEDFGYYHLPYALAFIEDKIVFGFANIDKSFVYNSIWLNLYPIFFLDNKNFNFLTLPSFLLFLSFTLFSINKLFKKSYVGVSEYYLIIVLFYFLLKFTRISEFGVDFAATIYSVLSIFYFLRFYENNREYEKKIHFYLNLTFSFFSILIKLSTAPIILLPLYLYFTNFKNLKFYIFDIKFLLIYFVTCVFLIQQFIYTGCVFFPTNFTCLNTSWFNPDYLNLSKNLELTNKSYSLAKDKYTPEEYLTNFTWFIFWIKRSFIEIIEHLMTMILPSLIFFLFLKKNKKVLLFNQRSILYIFCLVSLIYWLNFSPVFRFSIPFFVTLVFLVLSNFFTLKKFSFNIFIIFFTIFLIFSVSKNSLRIYGSEKIFLGIQTIENKYKINETYSNKYANIYYPDIKKNKKNGWQGRLCWNTPFICSYNKLEVQMKSGYLILSKIKKNNND
tara:strand:+ start:300 stop:1961 length:1662 start_codon:yes stop_codon:yes gene_type:complete